jgi:hypothetical protein
LTYLRGEQMRETRSAAATTTAGTARKVRLIRERRGARVGYSVGTGAARTAG